VAGASVGSFAVTQGAWHTLEVELLLDVTGRATFTLDGSVVLDTSGDYHRNYGINRYDFSVVGTGSTLFDEVSVWAPGGGGIAVGEVRLG
jgi:hypothetical protein